MMSSQLYKKDDVADWLADAPAWRRSESKHNVMKAYMLATDGDLDALVVLSQTLESPPGERMHCIRP